jgi:hypothetical protein
MQACSLENVSEMPDLVPTFLGQQMLKSESQSFLIRSCGWRSVDKWLFWRLGNGAPDFFWQYLARIHVGEVRLSLTRLTKGVRVAFTIHPVSRTYCLTFRQIIPVIVFNLRRFVNAEEV